MENLTINNGRILEVGLFNITVLYIDTKDHYADHIFINNKIPVNFIADYRKDGEPYELVTCKVRKKYRNKFAESLKTLEKRVLLSDHNDYLKYCKELFDDINSVVLKEF